MKRIIPFIVCMLCLMLNFSHAQLNQITVDDAGFFPEDITTVNNVAYVSGLGDGTVRSFDLTQANPMAQTFATAEEGYTQAWGLKSDGTVLLSLLNNADFIAGNNGPAKLVEYNIASGEKTAEWDLPAGVIGHTVSIVDGKYYVTNFGFPQIFEVDPTAGTVTEWFTSDQWDPSISGLGGTIYDNNGGFYISQGNKLWYLPISDGASGMLQEVNVSGLDIVDADGISWVDSSNTLFYATNDTGDPANVGTAYKLVFSSKTTALASVVATGLDDSSGLWYYENDGSEYVFVLESQFGALFGINTFEPPFNIEIIEVSTELTNEEKARALQQGIELGDPAVLVYVSDEQYIQHNLFIPSGKETIAGFYPGFPTGVTVDIHRTYEIGDYVVMHTTFGGAWGAISGSGTDQVVFDVWRFEDGLAVEHWDNIGDLMDDMDGTTQTDGALTPATDLENTDANQALLEEMAQTLFVNGDWTNLRDYFDLDAYIQHSVGAGPDGSFLETLEGATGLSFYDDVKFIHTLGNFGLVMSEGGDITGQDPDGQYAYYDLFRMENGKIVEHWDVIQLIPPSDQWANPNGKWGDDAIITGTTVSVYNSFEDATLTGGQQAFYGAAGPVAVSDDVEFPQFINFYDIDVDDFGLTMTLFNNSDAADLLLPEGRFDRYYFAFDEDMSNVNIAGGSSGLTVGASVTPLPAGYEIPLADLFGTGYPLPITLPNGGFVLELGGGTDLTELGQTIRVDFGFTAGVDLILEASVANQLYDQYETVDYTFTLTNEGDAIATDIEIDAMLPEGMAYTSHNTANGKFVPFTGAWMIETLAAETSAVLNVTLFTLVEDQEITYFTQVVALDQTDADSTPDSSSGEVTEDDEAAVTISPKSNGGFGTGTGSNDLELSITTDKSTYNIYEVVGYTVSVTNNGETTATGIEVSTPLPDGMAYTGTSTDDGSYNVFFQTWTIEELGAGETAVLELDLFTLVGDQPITNFVQIFVANELDPDSTPGNNTTGIPTEDDEAAVTIQVAGNNVNLPQMNDTAFSSSTFAGHTAVSLAPNPFYDITNFKVQLVEGGEYLLQVFDMNGKEVNSQQMELNEGVNTFSYDGSHLTNGLYSYLLSNNKESVSGRMIIVK